jgi:hypothetical protein
MDCCDTRGPSRIDEDLELMGPEHASLRHSFLSEGAGASV